MVRSIKVQSGIYKITNRVNGKVYVGYSTYIPYRWYKHRDNLQRRIHSNRYLQQDWNCFGKDSFEFCLLEYVPYFDDMIRKEKQWIRHYKNMGEIYNIVI